MIVSFPEEISPKLTEEENITGNTVKTNGASPEDPKMGRIIEET